MAESKKRPTKKPMPLKFGDLQSLRKELDDLKQVVKKHKGILQVNDGWHSRIAKMIGKVVIVCLGQYADDNPRTEMGYLLYADRYTIGLRVGDQDRIYNKGKIEYITLT